MKVRRVILEKKVLEVLLVILVIQEKEEKKDKQVILVRKATMVLLAQPAILVLKVKWVNKGLEVKLELEEKGVNREKLAQRDYKVQLD